MSVPVTKRRRSPATMALAYRIRAVGVETGWGLTLSELAERLDEKKARVSRVLDLVGWRHRLRSEPRRYDAWRNCNLLTLDFDRALDAMDGGRPA